MAPTPLATKLAPNRTAVVIIDYQNDFVAKGGALDKAGKHTPAFAKVEEVLYRLTQAARNVGALVVLVRCEYNRQGGDPYLSEAFLDQAERRFNGLYTKIPVCVQGTWGADFFGRVQAEPADVVVTKHRFSAFEGTDLDLLLRSRKIRTLVFAGVVTHVCVESSVRAAFFKDYSCVVVRDGTASWNPEWHDYSLAVMDWGFAEVTDSEKVLATWKESAPRSDSAQSDFVSAPGSRA